MRQTLLFGPLPVIPLAARARATAAAAGGGGEGGQAAGSSQGEEGGGASLDVGEGEAGHAHPSSDRLH